MNKMNECYKAKLIGRLVRLNNKGYLFLYVDWIWYATEEQQNQGVLSTTVNRI